MHGQEIAPNLRSWASELDEGTARQAARTARLPILAGPVALMPDAHFGIGATVGSVIATDGAIIPSAVGVDVGCGMIAARTDLNATDLPDNLNGLLDRIAVRVPAGVGESHNESTRNAGVWFDAHQMPAHLDRKQRTKALVQFGTLGSGNHFVEVCLDGADQVWVVVHSGSRGLGNEIARGHIAGASRDFADVVTGYRLEDRDLAWLVQGTAPFDAYIADLMWLQDYAAGSREAMVAAVLQEMFRAVGRGRPVETINCHHNYAVQETHGDRQVWVTRKGAIRAMSGDLGIIPGSMGTSTFIVEGLGSSASWCSCSHGAGRRLSRKSAERELTVESLHEAMTGKTWLSGSASRLVDEHPAAYKDIESVMADQSDLVRVRDRLTQILNYKG